jgi:uncharacterized repeat protein (TIGR02543 family)
MVYNITTETFSIPEPVRDGYRFEGWYRNSDFSGARVYTVNKGSVGNINLYAKWLEYGNYVINTNTGRIHLPGCSSVSEMNPKNRAYYEGYLYSLKNQGYITCQRCLKGH